MSTPDPFAEDDAAYVLGALSETQRAAFEEHMSGCADCRARVAEIADVPMLLEGLPMTVLSDSGEAPPDTLLPGLLRRAAAERRRRTWLISGLAGVAAACLVALVVLAWPNSGSSAPRQVAMSAVIPSPVHASAALVDKKWGTQIELTCRYDDASGEPTVYWLEVHDKAGKVHPAGSWTLQPGGQAMRFVADTSVPRDQITSVEITLPGGKVQGGTPILRLNT